MTLYRILGPGELLYRVTLACTMTVGRADGREYVFAPGALFKVEELGPELPWLLQDGCVERVRWLRCENGKES